MKKTDDTEQYARSYIDTALKALGQGGIATEDYENAVRRAATAFEDLMRVRRRSSDREPVASG